VRSKRQLEEPLASVVVATRNHGRMLEGMVAAVAAQSFRGGHELIVVDDESDDGTEALMEGIVPDSELPITYVRLRQRLKPAGARNVGLFFALGRCIAFTDSDCVPDPEWIKNGLEAFADPRIGIVQGRTGPLATAVPFFSHFIVTERFDGTFSTSNVLYRREALAGHRFNPAIWYWEDADLGWRVFQSGWGACFADSAVVRHHVLAQKPRDWILWPRLLASVPAKTARYPRFREHLFLGVWIRPLHLLFDLAVVGAALTPWMRPAFLLAVPYALSFGRTRGIGGRLPVAKIAAYVAWDTVALASLLAGSVKHRQLVL
jgi:glycosyltransferase involved in cell wall biosynthesis